MDDQKSVPSYATSAIRKRPRSRAEWEALRHLEILQGFPTGNVGNRVWKDANDHSEGFYELDANGIEIAWFPTPGFENREGC